MRMLRRNQPHQNRQIKVKKVVKKRQLKGKANLKMKKRKKKNHKKKEAKKEEVKKEEPQKKVEEPPKKEEEPPKKAEEPAEEEEEEPKKMDIDDEQPKKMEIDDEPPEEEKPQVEPDQVEDNMHSFPPEKEDLSDADIEKADQFKSDGRTALSDGDYKKALDLLTKALQIQPNSSMLIADRARCWLKLKKTKQCDKRCRSCH